MKELFDGLATRCIDKLDAALEMWDAGKAKCKATMREAGIGNGNDAPTHAGVT